MRTSTTLYNAVCEVKRFATSRGWRVDRVLVNSLDHDEMRSEETRAWAGTHIAGTRMFESVDVARGDMEVVFAVTYKEAPLDEEARDMLEIIATTDFVRSEVYVKNTKRLERLLERVSEL